MNLTKGTIVASDVRVADGHWTRFLGLMGRRQMEEGEALHIVPCSSIHTAFMRFSIDAVFLDPGGRVTKIARRLRPFRLAIGRGARSVLELPGGRSEVVGLDTGDQLTFLA
jgi:hypothetical protein